MEAKQYKEFWNLIDFLHENELLEFILLIGSWAEYIYAQSGLLPGFTENLRTLDVDFLIKNKGKPNKPINLMAIAKEAGYTIDRDVLEGTTKLYTSGLMEVEFIIEQKGKGISSVLETNLGVNAEALRHVGLLKNHATEIKIFGYKINVPIPEAYVIHKIIINQSRGVKAEKDRQAIFALMPYLDKEKFQAILEQVSKKERKISHDFQKMYGYL